jgi:hypothetical protein
MTRNGTGFFAATVMLLGLAITACPAIAEPRQKTMAVQAGTAVRVSKHTYFKASTCQAPVVPKVVIRQKPTRGVLKVKEAVLPLRRARTELGQKCIGKPMRSAIIEYTASPNASGDDMAMYDVIFPSTCKRCTNYEVTVLMTISADIPPPTSLAPAGDDDDGTSN